jgi:TolA-binding protein
MDSRVRSERFEPPMSFLRAPASIDMDFALDQDVGPDEADLPPDNISEEEPRDLRPVRAVALWLSMAVLGVLLAFVWQYVGAQLWSDTQGWLAFAAGSTSSGSNRVEQQSGPISGELDALKKEINELRATQHQMAANMMSLQAGQQELQRRVTSFQGGHWYSDFTSLTYPTAVAKKPAAAASPKQMPTARAPAETQDANAGRRNNGEPLSLTSPRP